MLVGEPELLAPVTANAFGERGGTPVERHAFSIGDYAITQAEVRSTARTKTGPRFPGIGRKLSPPVRSQNAGGQRAGSPDESKEYRGIFGRIVATGLRAQGKRGGEREDEGCGKQGFFQVHVHLESVLFMLLLERMTRAEVPFPSEEPVGAVPGFMGG